MAKKYNYKKAKELINTHFKELESAELGIKEDLDWTSEEIWNHEEGFLIELEEETTIAGIRGSTWGTPVITLFFKTSNPLTMECHDNGTSESKTLAQSNILNAYRN